MSQDKSVIEHRQTFDLMLECLQLDSQITPTNLDHLSPNSWELIVEMAIRLGVANLLYYHIHSHPILTHVHTPLVSRLHDDYLNTALENMERYRELHRVLNAFRSAGITPIVLKGIFLAQSVYGNVALRTMNDIDLLVRNDDLTEAEKCLHELGYFVDEERKLKRWYINNHFHMIFCLADKPIRLELHWNLVRPNSRHKIDIEKLWSRSERVKVAGVETRSLSIEDLVIHLCVHASHHASFAFYAFRSLVDIHRFLECNRTRIDWNRLLHLAEEWKAVNSLFITMRLTQNLLGTVIPVEVLAAITKDGIKSPLIDWAEDRIIDEMIVTEDTENLNPTLAVLSKSYDQSLLTISLQDKLFSLVKLIFINKTELAELYSLNLRSPLIYVFYLVRLFELVKRYSLPTLWLFLGDPELARWAEKERRQLAIARYLAVR